MVQVKCNPVMKKPDCVDSPRLVFGLGGGYIYALPDYPTTLPKLLSTFENDVLVSTVDMPIKVATIIKNAIGNDRMYLDSGGFTLFREQSKMGADSPEFHKRCEKMRKKFLKLLDVIHPKECFELDNDYFLVDPDDLLSPKNFLREEIKEIVGYYPTPVFKLHQGIEYWRKLCESEMYPRLAIGGLAQTKSWNTNTDLLKEMTDYVRQCGKKVHLLGCQNVQAFKRIQPDTVDYSIFQMGINLPIAKAEHYGISIEEAKKMKPNFREFAHMIPVWATAKAIARSFLYDSYRIEN